jgi:exosortase D (VPLPA-CTERM-specific)
MTIPYSTNLSASIRSSSKLPETASWWLVPAFAVASLILASFAGLDGLNNLYDRWAHEDEYGYGFLAAGLVLFFLWQQRNEIRSLSSGPKWPGLLLVIGAQLFGILGALSESYFVQQVAFISTLLGIAVVTFGIKSIRVFFPLALMLFLTIPLPYTLQAIITLKLQLLSTNLGVAVIRLIGIPVFVEGNVIDLGQYKLQVAEACSGLRYLLPFTCISFILAYLYRAPVWKRAIIVASAPPITVLINSFRIAVVALLVDNFGSGMAEGFVHDFEGWVIFLFGGALLAAEILVLEGFRLSRLNVESIFSEKSVTCDWMPTRNIAAAAAMFTCAVAVITISSIAWVHARTPGPSRLTFSTFPQRIGDWSSHEGQLDPAVLAVLKSSDYYVSDFSEPGSSIPVNVFVAYYDSLNKGAAIHSPQVCLPASGWEFASIEQRDFRELTPGTSGSFNRVVVQKGQQKILMYYWFQQRERRTADEFRMKYYLLVDSVMKSRRDGALVRIYTRILPGEKGAADAEVKLQNFAKTVVPTMSGYLPQ